MDRYPAPLQAADADVGTTHGRRLERRGPADPTSWRVNGKAGGEEMSPHSEVCHDDGKAETGSSIELVQATITNEIYLQLREARTKDSREVAPQ